MVHATERSTALFNSLNQRTNFGDLTGIRMNVFSPHFSGSVPHCLQTDPTPTHTCTSTHTARHTHQLVRASPLEGGNSKSQRQPRFLTLSTLRHTKGKSFFFLFSTQNRCPAGVWNQLQGELCGCLVSASSGCCARAPHALLHQEQV